MAQADYLMADRDDRPEQSAFQMPEAYAEARLARLYRQIPLSAADEALLRRAFAAAASLYGVLALEDFWPLFNAMFPGAVPARAFFAFAKVARHDFRDGPGFFILGEEELWGTPRRSTARDRLIVNPAYLDDEGYADAIDLYHPHIETYARLGADAFLACAEGNLGERRAAYKGHAPGEVAEALAEAEREDAAFAPWDEETLRARRDELGLDAPRERLLRTYCAALADLYGIAPAAVVKDVLDAHHPGLFQEETLLGYLAFANHLEGLPFAALDAGEDGTVVVDGTLLDADDPKDAYEALQDDIDPDLPYYLPTPEEVETLAQAAEEGALAPCCADPKAERALLALLDAAKGDPEAQAYFRDAALGLARHQAYLDEETLRDDLTHYAHQAGVTLPHAKLNALCEAFPAYSRHARAQPLKGHTPAEAEALMLQ